MIVWTVLTWILTPILTNIFGGVGFPLTLLILSTSFIIVITVVKKIVYFNFLKNTLPFFFSSLLMGMIVFFLFKIDMSSLFSLIISIFGGIITYSISLKLIFKIDILKEGKNLWKTFQQ